MHSFCTQIQFCSQRVLLESPWLSLVDLSPPFWYPFGNLVGTILVHCWHSFGILFEPFWHHRCTVHFTTNASFIYPRWPNFSPSGPLTRSPFASLCTLIQPSHPHTDHKAGRRNSRSVNKSAAPCSQGTGRPRLFANSDEFF